MHLRKDKKWIVGSYIIQSSRSSRVERVANMRWGVLCKSVLAKETRWESEKHLKRLELPKRNTQLLLPILLIMRSRTWISLKLLLLRRCSSACCLFCHFPLLCESFPSYVRLIYSISSTFYKSPEKLSSSLKCVGFISPEGRLLLQLFRYKEVSLYWGL